MRKALFRVKNREPITFGGNEYGIGSEWEILRVMTLDGRTFYWIRHGGRTDGWFEKELFDNPLDLGKMS